MWEGALRGLEDTMAMHYGLGSASEAPRPAISSMLVLSPGGAELEADLTSRLIKLQLRRPAFLSCKAAVRPEMKVFAVPHPTPVVKLFCPSGSPAPRKVHSWVFQIL